MPAVYPVSAVTNRRGSVPWVSMHRDVDGDLAALLFDRDHGGLECPGR
jgi:hypothetical protein